jgi:hypothetical protein
VTSPPETSPPTEPTPTTQPGPKRVLWATAESCTPLDAGTDWVEWDFGYTGAYVGGPGFGRNIDRRLSDTQHRFDYDVGNGHIVSWTFVDAYSCGPA